MSETVYYYGSAHKLDAAIADVFSDIRAVIREVEHLCEREARASAEYRNNPPEYMKTSWHPWWSFVITGNAAYLGWDSPSGHLARFSTARSEVCRYGDARAAAGGRP